MKLQSDSPYHPAKNKPETCFSKQNLPPAMMNHYRRNYDLKVDVRMIQTYVGTKRTSQKKLISTNY